MATEPLQWPAERPRAATGVPPAEETESIKGTSSTADGFSAAR